MTERVKIETGLDQLGYSWGVAGKSWTEVAGMKKSSGKKKVLSFAGAGLALGAAFGILLGMLLFDNPWYGLFLGAVIGLLVVILVDLIKAGKK